MHGHAPRLLIFPPTYWLQHAMCLDVLESKLQLGANVLDVGCGSGYMTVCMALMVCEISRLCPTAGLVSGS